MRTARQATTARPLAADCTIGVSLPIEFTAFCELHRRRYLSYALLHTGDETQAGCVVRAAFGELVTHWHDALASPSVAAYAWPLLKRHVAHHTAQLPEAMYRRVPSGLSDEAVLRDGLQFTETQIAETTGRQHRAAYTRPPVGREKL